MSKTLMIGKHERGLIRNFEWCPNLIVSETTVAVPPIAVPICLQMLSNGTDVLETIRHFLDAKSTHEWTTFSDPKSDESVTSWEYGAMQRLNAQDVLYLLQACEKLNAERIANAAVNYFVYVVHLQPPATTQNQLKPMVHGGTGFETITNQTYA